jgi:hypothetical protein
MTPYSEITKCRISGSTHLIPVLSLGTQYLTGVFPKSFDAPLSQGPLDLVWCPDSGLLQMKQSYAPTEMYGANYGYRSGLNASMVRHLQQKAARLEQLARLSADDVVLDIGSNDATLLKAYSPAARRIGIDPTGDKFKDYYGDIRLVPDFFSAATFREASTQPAKIITAIAMFYDLERPLEFLRDVEEVLAADGVFHFEQSYMPSMLRTNSYDSICHEHLEFYSFKIVKQMLEDSGLRVIDVQMNDINGGSFAVTACKTGAAYHSNAPVIEWLLHQEDAMGLDTPRPYREFETRVFQHRRDLRALVNALVADGKTIAGYGASTKGNVLLQFCGFTAKEIPFIAEVNDDKVGAFTPGTRIPIVSETYARGRAPDYFLVLPWHFKHGIIEREKTYLANGGKFIFPLPEITIV